MEEPPARIGDMLVAAGFVTEAQVQQALDQQQRSGRKLGEELVALGFVTEVQLTQILSNQLSVPWVSLYRVPFSRELLNLLPAQLAERYGVIPVYKRHVRHEGETLFVATDDPTNTGALAEVRQYAGMPVKVTVAPPSEVRAAIRVYYFGESPSAHAQSAESRTRQSGSPPAASRDAPPAQAARSSAPPADSKAERRRTRPARTPPASKGNQQRPRNDRASTRRQDAPGGDVEGSQGADRAEDEPSKSNMITLTLLDGTEVRLPAQKGGGESAGAPSDAGPTDSLTASDLVSALLARAQGNDVSDLLPEDTRWETMFATLLTILLRKGLIADWEFVDEWRKREG